MEEKKPIHCTLTDNQLAEKADQWITELIFSGGKSWVMNVPARVNSDPDLIFAELKDRFKKLIEPAATGPVWVKASDPNIKDGNYIARYKPDDIEFAHDPVGMAFADSEYVHFICPSLYDIKWRRGHKELMYLSILDESGQSTLSQERADFIREVNNRDLGGLGVKDNEGGTVEDIARQDIQDGKELSAHYAHIEACEQKEVVEFAEWIDDNAYCKVNGLWRSDSYPVGESQNLTTQQLYELFKKQKNA